MSDADLEQRAWEMAANAIVQRMPLQPAHDILEALWWKCTPSGGHHFGRTVYVEARLAIIEHTSTPKP